MHVYLNLSICLITESEICSVVDPAEGKDTCFYKCPLLLCNVLFFAQPVKFSLSKSFLVFGNLIPNMCKNYLPTTEVPEREAYGQANPERNSV